MQVTSNKIDDLNMSVVISLEKGDYQEDKKKKLNDYRRKADLRGFRKGMAPMSLIEKMYGAQALGETINKIVTEQLNNFIDENKLNILGEPLPSEKESTNDWENGESFTFEFDLALAPEFTVSVGSEDVIPSYEITVNDKAVSDYKESMLKQIGHLEDDAEAEGGKKLVAAEENQEAYDKLFGEGNVKSTEEFEAKVKENLAREYAMESEYRLSQDIREYLISKADIKLPEAFLKRWLFAANDGKFTMEQIESEFAAFAKDFRWQMIRGKIMKEQNIEIKKEDMLAEAKKAAAYQFAMYGMNNVPDADLEGFANQMLADQEQMRRIFEKLESDKVVDCVKGLVTLEQKSTTMDELYKKN